jgi:hypothetical protein
VIEASSRRSTSLWPLIPSHSDRVECMEISVNSAFGTLATKYNDSRAGKNSRVAVTGCWGCTRNFGLDPPWAVDIEHVGVVQILETSLLSNIIVSTEDNQRRSSQSSWVTSSRCGGNTFNLRKGPQPFSFN